MSQCVISSNILHLFSTKLQAMLAEYMLQTAQDVNLVKRFTNFFANNL